MLKAAAVEADQAIRDSLPTPEECGHEFSQSFQRRMRRLSRRARHPVFYKLVKSAACFILAVVLAGGTWLTVDAEARAAFVKWVKETTSTYSVYHFAGMDAGEQTSTEYALAWTPVGYAEQGQFRYDDGLVVYYADEDGLMLEFCYTRSTSSGYWFLETSNCTEQSTCVGDVPADFYRSNDPQVANALVWTSPDGQTAFYLSGFFSEEELVEMAECVVSYDPARIKTYAPAWLPDGFREYKQINLETMRGIFYQNPDGQEITFDYTYGADATDVIIASDYTSVSTVAVGDAQADFYQASQEEYANALVWQTETDECLFCILAPLPEEVLVQIAESVIEK